ncbi:hypothetical protein [Streptomyces sp. NBC_00083]|uniref:hypothetical protein n=1 Tax=Streptomyces sp. NBC_00083 TaxID=2975647 RepID=UPI00225B0586|nr:hypothetical protein [Streptomyces sp. NBC_00083]MCX5387445.1 hypothetical protein [Streptomyces sp. NBC_00083]
MTVEAVLAMISGLGGAGLGAGGALWVQRAKRRDDAVAATIAAQRAEGAAAAAADRIRAEAAAAARKAEQELVLETVATARVAARVWWTSAQGMLAGIAAGREVDVEQYRAESRAELREFTEALYRLAGRDAADRSVDGRYQRAFADLLTASSQHIIDAAHRHARQPLTNEETAVLLREAEEAHSAIAAYLLERTGSITGRQVGVVFAYPARRGP